MNGAIVVSTLKVNIDMTKHQYHTAYTSVLFMHTQRFTKTGHSTLTVLVTYN
jgi:hypothetical protein